MRNDYFDGLVPTVPTTKNASGDSANPHEHYVSPPSPPSPPEKGKAEKTKAGRVLHNNFGKGYVHPDGRVETGRPEPMPPAAVAWPADLTDMLRRMSAAQGWTRAETCEFIHYSRRSPEGIDDARACLSHAAMPDPAMLDRRRKVRDMLAADPGLRYAYTCADTGADPVVLTLAIRDAGTCELGIPRAKFDALALPQLIDQLTNPRRPDAGNT